MDYDFKTILDRSKDSTKWKLMHEYNKDIENVVPLSVADMEFKLAPEIRDGLKEYLDEAVFGYSYPPQTYYDAVIYWMKKHHNFDIKKEWIVNTSGVVVAIYNAIKAFSNENDGVIVFTPVYYPFFETIKKSNRKVVECPLINENLEYKIDFDKFEELASKSENKILLFSSPHNPVGRVWKKEELLRLQDIIIDNDLILLSDEIHSDIVFSPNRHTVFQTLSKELQQRSVTFTSASKTFNLAGANLSNIIISNDTMKEKFQKEINDNFISSISPFSYKAFELAYTKAEGWYEQMLKVVYENQKMVCDFFKEKFPDIKTKISEGTYLMWIDFRNLKMEDEMLSTFLKDKAGWFLDDGYIFGENARGFERVNVAASKETIQNSLNRLERALKNI